MWNHKKSLTLYPGSLKYTPISGWDSVSIVAFLTQENVCSNGC
jgi:hypothetical protein